MEVENTYANILLSMGINEDVVKILLLSNFITNLVETDKERQS